ncbi:MAG TPA: acyltransferase [Caulobacteraceae bacterium]|nr:acyltransferase [Caulobacteraceae bacterium]
MAKTRYETLDALRGVAALAVVVYHLHAFNVTPDLLPSAHLAVDFFFVLSGFVVAHAYEAARLGRMSWLDFASRRLTRLMPLASLGAAVGLAVLLVKWRLFPGAEPPLANILLAGILNLFMLPSFVGNTIYEHGIFPGDGPLWSLFFELAVNLVWGWIGVRLTMRQLALFVAASGLTMVALALLQGSTRMGVGPETFWGGMARASFGFTLGVLLHRLRGALSVPARRWAPLACAGALALAFAGPAWLVHGPVQTLVWDLAWMLLALPAVVVVGAGQDGGGWLSKRLGELSYPVYVLHWPCVEVLAGVRQKLLPSLDWAAFSVLAMALVVLLAWLTLKLYDEPARRWLSRRLARRAGPVVLSA